MAIKNIKQQSISLTTIILSIIIIIICNCTSKAVPDAHLKIDPDFLTLIKTLKSNDTLTFVHAHYKKKFAIVSVDSVTYNTKGWFINQLPHTIVECYIKQLGHDTVKLLGNNMVFVNKSNASSRSSICIQLNNFYYHDSMLPKLSAKLICLGNLKIKDYYDFNTGSLFHSDSGSDIKRLYWSPKLGILGFETNSAQTWYREF
jgi:hypothetical protein